MADLEFPKPFLDQLEKQFPESSSKIISSLRGQSPVSVRINPSKHFSKSGLSPVPWSSYGKYLEKRPVFTLDPNFHAGAYYVQEASSMFLEEVVKQSLELDQPQCVLDLCAAPGGKSTHLLSLLSQDSLLVANDVIGSRSRILLESLQKWGHCNTLITNSDPSSFTRVTGFFNLIVVDAPCSGEGLFRKDSSAINHWSPESVVHCAKRQKRILQDIWPSLKEGGILVYSTCTFNTIENEGNLKAIKELCDAEFIEINLKKEWGITPVQEGNILGYRFLPFQVNGEGFFISAIRKKSREERTKLKDSKRFVEIPNKKFPQLKEWITFPDKAYYFTHGHNIHFLPISLKPQIEHLSHYLNVVSAGTALATNKQGKLIPHSDLALSIHFNRNHFMGFDLDLSRALHYLKRESIILTNPKRGFAFVSFEGNPLGWINQLENRINNLYPSNWRIRMSLEASKE